MDSLRRRDLIATDDHAEIRGLVTARLVFVAELPLSMIGSFRFPYLISVLSIVPQWDNQRLSFFVLVGNRISN